MMKIVAIKLFFPCILMLNILIGQNTSEYDGIEKEIMSIRQEYNDYYRNANFKKALEKVTQKYDDKLQDTTILIYVKILEAKTNYILGDIEEALSNLKSIKELTRDYSRIVRHQLLTDKMGKVNCKIHEHKSNNFCLCQYLEDRENLETLTEESLSQNFMDIYVVIKDTSKLGYKRMNSKSQVENKEDGKDVDYELEPPTKQFVESYKNQTYDMYSIVDVIKYENDNAIINRRDKLETSGKKLAFIDLIPSDSASFALKLRHLPIFTETKAIYKLLIDQKYKYTFSTDAEMRNEKKQLKQIYWDRGWSLAQYKDDERIIFYFPQNKLNNYYKAFKNDKNLNRHKGKEEYDKKTWGLEDYARYSYGSPDSLIQEDFIINNNINEKSIEIELTNQYVHFNDERRKIKFSKLFLYGCIFTSIIVMSSL